MCLKERVHDSSSFYKKPISGHWGSLGLTAQGSPPPPKKGYRVPSENCNAKHVCNFSDCQKNARGPNRMWIEGIAEWQIRISCSRASSPWSSVLRPLRTERRQPRGGSATLCPEGEHGADQLQQKNHLVEQTLPRGLFVTPLVFQFFQNPPWS